jgi:hypothetical protein
MRLMIAHFVVMRALDVYFPDDLFAIRVSLWLLWISRTLFAAFELFDMMIAWYENKQCARRLQAQLDDDDDDDEFERQLEALQARERQRDAKLNKALTRLRRQLAYD